MWNSGSGSPMDNSPIGSRGYRVHDFQLWVTSPLSGCISKARWTPSIRYDLGPMDGQAVVPEPIGGNARATFISSQVESLTARRIGSVRHPRLNSPGNCSHSPIPALIKSFLFLERDFEGCTRYRGAVHGTYNNPGEDGQSANDSVASIRVGTNARVRVCAHADMTSPCEEFSRSAIVKDLWRTTVHR